VQVLHVMGALQELIRAEGVQNRQREDSRGDGVKWLDVNAIDQQLK
jgi:hypothetical protein